MGVAVLSWGKWIDRPDHVWWLLLIIGAAAFYACCNVLLKDHHEAPILAQAAVFFIAGSAVLWLVHWLRGGELFCYPPSPVATAWLLYTIIIGSGFSFGLYLLLMRASMMKALSTAFISPIVALAIDYICEPHVIPWHTGFGILLITFCVGVNGWSAAPQSAEGNELTGAEPDLSN
jgi:drug/metabolite transporter (DMT)-like permease